MSLLTKVVITFFALLTLLSFFMSRPNSPVATQNDDQTTFVMNLGSASTMEFVKIPEGKFYNLSLKSFWISKYEVTQGQWKAIMRNANPSEFKKGDQYPVTNVTWNDITNGFLRAMNSSFPGQGTFKLPSEAEWEYACRAGTTTPFYWGDDMNGDYCWFRLNTSGPTYQGARQVGLKKPNAWGLHDMIGNVEEWVEDSYDDEIGLILKDPEESSSPKKILEKHAVIRGGTGGSPQSECRSDYRTARQVTLSASSLGFRLVLAPGPYNKWHRKRPRP